MRALWLRVIARMTVCMCCFVSSGKVFDFSACSKLARCSLELASRVLKFQLLANALCACERGHLERFLMQASSRSFVLVFGIIMVHDHWKVQFRSVAGFSRVG